MANFLKVSSKTLASEKMCVKVQIAAQKIQLFSHYKLLQSFTFKPEAPFPTLIVENTGLLK